jgi:hypothetical protein
VRFLDDVTTLHPKITKHAGFGVLKAGTARNAETGHHPFDFMLTLKISYPPTSHLPSFDNSDNIWR